jgi:uncharacterized SAM-binding protein YcdF (DUF218 family)
MKNVIKPQKLIVVVLAVFALSFIILFAYFAGDYLVVDEKPRTVDAIIVCAGDKGTRTEKGVKLFQEGYAKRLILSGGIVYHNTTEADLMAMHAVELSVDRAKIIEEAKADSTYQNAVFTKKLMQRYGFKSAIVVSSNYHMRRVKLTFDRQYEGTGIKLYYAAARDPDFDPARWWANNKSIMYTITEYVKLLGYQFGQGV